MKRKNIPTMLQSIGEKYTEKNLKVKMMADFKASLLEPERVVFTDDKLNNPNYGCFTEPNEDGIMTCELYLDRPYFTCVPDFVLTKQYKVALVTATPDLLYDFTSMRVGVIHTANIAGTGYVITYRMDGR